MENGDILTGRWENELNSCMNITDIENGVIRGTYQTYVGDDHIAEPLIGFWKYIEENNSILMSFTVLWNNMDNDKLPTVTAWTGECNDNQIINTTWILTSSEKPEDQWKNTLISKDVFTKIN